MTGITLILVLALMGGLIAYLGDKLGSKIGKKRLRLFGLRPHDTSVVMTIVSGMLVAALTITVLTIASKEVRTALFGMKQMRAEIASLTATRDKANEELSAQSAKIEELDQKISEATQAAEQARQQKAAAEAQMKDAQAQMQQAQADLGQLQARYAEASTRLQEAQEQVRQAEAARDQLQQDVKSLEDTAKKLREGIVAVREGHVVFRSGEILYSGVLKSGQSEENTQKQLQEFLNQANIQVAGRIGVDPSTPVIWLSREAVENAASNLEKAKGDMYVRVCAAGNILSGEVVVSRLEMVGDKVVYPEDTLILTQSITVDPNSNESDLALMAFLKAVNRAAQADGVIPNPITGDVGAITSTELSNASEKIRSLGGKVVITAKARRDITVAGPVLLDLEIRPVGGLPREEN
ncbi:DUF3084 domain-containing protein [Acidaminococcus fermentans]|uniref:DUF3084 domain-containing protein n=1 Tax=Acidaminococcus fermentans TaxID=905 RepID=A0A6N7VX23_ACIFE|nr:MULTISPECIES: DUF3084 domain-containing protein [Acidaminococcus]MSS81651.1 DUF3084 domain-containing protein [Acidaminococcus fermentans]CDE94576.1 uncharacterized protein with the myosin-like protein domain [Acidaminococcus sp. CAG:542]